MGGKLGKSEKSSQAGEGFVEFLQGCGGALKSQMGPKKDPHGPIQGRYGVWCALRVRVSYFLAGTECALDKFCLSKPPFCFEWHFT